MSRVIFYYNGEDKIIQCQKEDKMEAICQSFGNKLQIDINNIVFLYKGNTLNKELTFEAHIKNEDKENNEMKILCVDANNDNTRNNIHKTKDIICPECKDNALVKFNSYAISLSGCKNGHSINNLSIEAFDKIQIVDYSKITCNKCNRNRHDSYQNFFYKCLDCKINLCALCKNNHETTQNTHKIIDYDKINYVCDIHKEAFIKYCENCKRNLCIKCKNEHKNHNCVHFEDIIPDDNNITNSNTKLKEDIDKLTQEIKLITDRLNNIINNLNIYYNKFIDITTSCNNNRNYQMIKNLNEYMNKNNIINKDIEKIISDDNISNKLKNLIFLFYKINNKIPTYDKPIIKEKEINQIQNEINGEGNIYTKNYIFNYAKEKEDNKDNEDFSFPTIVIDLGSTAIRAGLSEDESPRVRIPTCIGYPNYENKDNIKKYIIGKEAEDNREFLNFNFPIKRGIIQDIDAIESLFGHIFYNELKVDSSEHNILITGVSVDLMKKEEKLAQLMFDTFDVRGLSFIVQTKLGLYSLGKFNGLFIDSSESYTHLIPYIDSFPLKEVETCYKIGGRDLTDYLQNLILRESGQNISYLDAKYIKEKSIYCPIDYDEACKSGIDEAKYELPDSTIIVKDERIKCPEIFFNPNLIHKEEKGLAEECYDVLRKLIFSYGYDYHGTIYLLGGNSIIKGFAERFEKELKNLVPESKKDNIKIETSTFGMDTTFIGGSIASSVSTFNSNIVTRNEYDEYGKSIFEKKIII